MKSIESGPFAVDPALWADFLAGRRLACARLITLVENVPESVPEIRDRLIPLQRGGVRIGITGPPGVGKSTVTASLARRFLKAGRSVGIIAVDPSSPFTGGAFLGDRVRMQSVLDDDRAFIRSLASRDGHGGLSPATPFAADVLDAFGMDRILIETVGVGQTELDVLDCADLVVLVLQPATGDVIQALKAGILEIADLFLINKADLPGAESLLESLRFLFEISARRDRAAAAPDPGRLRPQGPGPGRGPRRARKPHRGARRLGPLRGEKAPADGARDPGRDPGMPLGAVFRARRRRTTTSPPCRPSSSGPDARPIPRSGPSAGRSPSERAEKRKESRTVKNADKNAWDEKFRKAELRDADFTSLSGHALEALYTPESLAGTDPTRRSACRANIRTRGASIRRCTGASSGRCGSSPAWGRPSETNRRYQVPPREGPDRAFRSPSTIRPSTAGIRTTACPPARSGRRASPIDTLADMERLFAGIPLGRVSTSMTINAPAAWIFTMFLADAEKQGVPFAELRGTLQNDILKEYIAQKEWIFPPEPHMRLITDLMAYCAEHVPQWNTISISGYHIREAGSTAAQELAFTLADGFAYVEHALEAGMDVDDFAPRLSFFFNAHIDFFEEIAKLRAARRIWARHMRERYKAKSPRSWLCRFHVQTAGCSLTAQQPELNIVRTALEALSGVLGGCQSLHTNSMDEALALPSEKAVEIALRTQQIIAFESGVPNVIDPLGGSYYVEKLTNELEEEAEAYFRKIDELGGIIRAIELGLPPAGDHPGRLRVPDGPVPEAEDHRRGQRVRQRERAARDPDPRDRRVRRARAGRLPPRGQGPAGQRRGPRRASRLSRRRPRGRTTSCPIFSPAPGSTPRSARSATR